MHGWRIRRGHSEALPLDALAPRWRRALRDFPRAGDIAGAFVARARQHPVPRFASDELLRAADDLRVSPRSPGDACALLNVDAVDLARLVLDGVLAIDDGHTLLSGAGAAFLLPSAPLLAATPSATTSLAALHYAVALQTRDVNTLSDRIYAFGRRPATAALAAPSVRSLDAALATFRARPRWIRVESETDAWNSWARPGVSRARAHASPRATYKLYIAPGPQHATTALRRAAAVIARSDAFGFKVAATHVGSRRPDHCVAYFATRPELERTAARLRRVLRSATANAVPFTGAIDAAGLLSWGADPAGDALVGSLRCKSWRRWVATRLAFTMALAAPTVRRSALAEFAMRRLALDGVDVARWSPRRPRWHDAGTLLS